MTKKLIFAVISILLLNITATSETVYKIDYYGVSSTVLDKNMASMTSDLYYTQLCEIQTFTITDKRSLVSDLEMPDPSIFEKGKLSFYTEISQKPKTNKWVTTIHIYNKENDSEYTESKEYDSYYKILMENKSALKESFVSLVQNDKSNGKNTNSEKNVTSQSAIAVSTENLAGTWKGEQTIEKIVIMRGGRGFVIFKNGASMNISIKVNNSSVIIAQIGKSNASYFPELPRAVALTAALEAEPIIWKLEMTSDDILTGVKQTLIQDGEITTKGELAVVWNRK